MFAQALIVNFSKLITCDMCRSFYVPFIFVVNLWDVLLVSIITCIYRCEVYRCLIALYFSDVTIKLRGKELFGHKFVLSARSDAWLNDLGDVLDLTGKCLRLDIYLFYFSRTECCWFLLGLLFICFF